MNGPQHAAMAKRLADVSDLMKTEPVDQITLIVALAQVHATIAQVAATIDASAFNRNNPEWQKVFGKSSE